MFLSNLGEDKGKSHFPLIRDQFYPGPVPFSLRGAGR